MGVAAAAAGGGHLSAHEQGLCRQQGRILLGLSLIEGLLGVQTRHTPTTTETLTRAQHGGWSSSRTAAGRPGVLMAGVKSRPASSRYRLDVMRQVCCWRGHTPLVAPGSPCQPDCKAPPTSPSTVSSTSSPEAGSDSDPLSPGNAALASAAWVEALPAVYTP